MKNSFTFYVLKPKTDWAWICFAIENVPIPFYPAKRHVDGCIEYKSIFAGEIKYDTI